MLTLIMMGEQRITQSTFTASSRPDSFPDPIALGGEMSSERAHVRSLLPPREGRSLLLGRALAIACEPRALHRGEPTRWPMPLRELLHFWTSRTQRCRMRGLERVTVSHGKG
jgi:hypothetical protein